MYNTFKYIFAGIIILGIIMTIIHKNSSSHDYIIREAKTADYPQINQLYIDTIHAVNSNDYTQEQRDLWAPKNQPATNWEKNFINHYVLVAEKNGLIVGFGDITSDDGYLDHLFVHKDFQGQGIATVLVERLEAYARSLGLPEIYTEASITAKPFFEKRGFTVTRKQDKVYKGLVFINYLMHKKLK